MKYLFTPLILIFLFAGIAKSQIRREVRGSLVDTTKQSLPGSSVKIVTETDSTSVLTDIDGKFVFSNIQSNKFTLYLSSFGYKGVIKHYSFLPNDTARVLTIPAITLRSESRQLKEVTIVGVNPVKFTEDTTSYKIAAYPVRDNAPVEDVLKKLPGVDVDANGNVTSQGTSITKIRINGKDFMGGDVQSATKNLPADILESVQVIDDYGDQANLTGVRTGTPNKILNFTIRADKNYGYSLQASAGDGADLLPKQPGVTDANRYVGTVNLFDFKGNRQLTVLGNVNNINTNTFNFGGGGNGGNGGGGAGGRQRGGGGAGGNTSLVSNKDGITLARAIGTNYRDQWGKTVSVYGSYSFSDNTTNTTTTALTTNSGAGTSSQSNKQSTDNPINHRFTFNLEWKPDTVNYLKVTPTFSYASTNSSSVDNEIYTVGTTTTKKYSTLDFNNSQSPTFGITALYNHRFPKRHNLSINLTATTAQTASYDNPVNTYTVGVSNVPANQVIITNNRTTTLGANLSYLYPIGKVSYLELNYTFNHSYTANDKETDTLSLAKTFNNYSLLSNNYNFTFTTNKVGLNFRVIEAKYNYTLGIAVQPSVLDGQSITTGLHTRHSQFNVIPTANYIYNISRNESLNINYNGSSTQPSFTQLQPVTDFSNALYLTQGNPDLKQQFTTNVRLTYRAFGLASGNIFFVNASYQGISDYVASNQITYPKLSKAALAADPSLSRYQNTILTKYLNTNGYTNSSINLFYSKPWQERRYTAGIGINGSYAVAPAFATNVDSNNVAAPMLKNIAKTLSLGPSLRFRVDIPNVVDVQAIGNYNLAKTDNSLSGGVFSQNTNIRSTVLGLTGKNYFKDWTVSYDYSKTFNYGYDIPVTNPNLLSAYLERRFLKQNKATIRFAVNDIFNQNTGFSTTTTGSSVVQTNTNRLGRFYMVTFSLRLQKFAGRAPTQQQDGGPGGFGGGGRGGNGGGGGGFGGGPGGF